MSGYNPAGYLPDYVIDPTVRKTWDEWSEIFYPGQKKPLWWHLGKWATKLGFAVRDGKLVYDPSAYKK